MESEADPIPADPTFHLLPDERIVRAWSAPRGRGVLTNARLVVLGHPRPVHRQVEWSVNLDRISGLAVQRVHGPPRPGITYRTGYGGGAMGHVRIDPTFEVLVDDIAVFVGDPNECGSLQQAVDEARTARCLSVHGRLLPYAAAPAGPAEAGVAAPTAPHATPQPGSAELSTPVPFTLFVAGVPFKATQVGHFGGERIFATGAGFPTPSFSVGGHIAADRDPGQIYGDQAETARMVVDIAQKVGVPVRVVDVEAPGEAAEEVAREISPEDALPVLLRSDGARLSGLSSVAPARVSQFLQGR